MNRLIIIVLTLFSSSIFAQDEFNNLLNSELQRNFEKLKTQATPAYYMAYRVHDAQSQVITASFGDLVRSGYSHSRPFFIDIRVGSHELDNTRDVGGGIWREGHQMTYEDDPFAIRNILWLITDQRYKAAVERYEQVKTKMASRVAAEDKSEDFTHETPSTYYEKPIAFKDLNVNVPEWEKRVKRYSQVFSANKEVFTASAYFTVELTRKYFVDSDGTSIVENAYSYRLSINASTVADDGMSLPLYKSYFALDPNDLPTDEQVIKDVMAMSQMLSALRKAPTAESYSGPCLMTAEASGVFFHEIFGHRIEGRRLKQESDAQTFKKKVGEMVLPSDLTLYFDPQLKKYKGIPLNGSYVYDDEGVRGQKVEIVKDGILKGFLMSRTPIENFPQSNGHGRAQIFIENVTRQSNLIVESSHPKTIQELRAMLITEAKKNNKEYGYMFDQVSGGFTQTGRYMPNAFNVTPLIVYRVYVDGRPDELVRGVDLVGTPLSIFSQIAACGDDQGAFNGYCGAESGSIPVSCVAPTVFVKMIETQKKAKSNNKPPILARP